MGSGSSKALHVPEPTSTPYQTVYDVEGILDIDGNTMDFSQFRGKTLMIVSIATNNPDCAEQLRQLGELEKKFEPLGMVFMVFPCNDFHNQPSSVVAVKAACSSAGYHGLVMEFAHVRGPNAHPLFAFLRLRDPDCQLENGTDMSKAITNKQGGVFGRWGIGYSPSVLEPFLNYAVAGRPHHKGLEESLDNNDT